MTDAPEPDAVRWTRSTRSGHAGNCVETAQIGGRVAVRDSKDPAGPGLSFSYDAWRSFVAGVRAGVFDLPEGS
jgi:hypothetical protein